MRTKKAIGWIDHDYVIGIIRSEFIVYAIYAENQQKAMASRIW